MIKNQSKRENMEIIYKSQFKRPFTNGIRSLLKRADATESVDIIYLRLYVTHIASLRVRHTV